MTNEKLFKETGKVFFDPIFQKVRDRRKKKAAKKPDQRYGYIEKSIHRAVVNGNVARLEDNSQDGTLYQKD